MLIDLVRVLLILGICSSAVSQEVPEWREVLADFESGRAYLFAGEVEISRTRVETATKPETIHQEIQTDLVQRFDYNKSLFRLDTQERWDYIQGPGFDELESTKTGDTKFVTPDHLVRKGAKSKAIRIDRPVSGHLIQDDLRLIGIMFSEELQTRHDLQKGLSFVEMFTSVQGNTVNVTRESEALVITVDLGVPESTFVLRRSTSFDSVRDFVPTRLLHQRVERMDGNEKILCTQNELNVTWSRVSDIYVPESTVETTYIIDGSDYSVAATHEVATKFKWRSVNTDLNPELFEVASIDVPKGSHVIYDGRSGQDVIIQHPLVPDAAKLQRIVAANGSGVPAPPSTGLGSLYFVVGLNVIAVLTLICLLWYRFQRRNR